MSNNLVDHWVKTVSRAPRALAVVECSNALRWSRKQLADSAIAWCSSLAPGFKLRGRRIVVAEPNGADWLRVFIGILLAEGIPAPIDPDEPPEVCEAVARAIGASWICTGGRLRSVRLPARIDRRDACLIKVTSGSSGFPKGFLFTHGQMAADGRQVCATMGIRESDLNLAVIPFGHSYGLGNLVIPLLIQGTAIACGSGPFPHAIASDCRKWKPTVLPAVPVLFRALANSEIPAKSLATLRVVISAGSPLPAADAQAFKDRFGRLIHGFYGSSETGGICFDRTGKATLAGRSVGTPLSGVRIVRGRGRRFAVESPAVMGRGRHSPRDLGEMSPAGELVLLGRSDRTVKIGAKRLDPAEVEIALKALTGVRDAVVIAHPGRGGSLAAAILSAESPAAIRRALAGRLAAWKLPDRILSLPEFPVTVRGKPDMRRIEAILRNGLPHEGSSSKGE